METKLLSYEVVLIKIKIIETLFGEIILQLDKWEEEKRERRRLRGRQRTLKRVYREAVITEDWSMVEILKDRFLQNLETERKVEFMGVETGYYPIFLDNVLRAQGFQIYYGKIPTVSGVYPSEMFHVAYDKERMIVIEGMPSTVLSEIADIQPLTFRAVLGLCHTTWIRDKPEEHDDWEERYTRISTALGIARLQVPSTSILKRGIELDPREHEEKLGKIGDEVGLTSFLNLSVDKLPIYGAFRAPQWDAAFKEKSVKRMLSGAIEYGHLLTSGSLTNFDPFEALRKPTAFIKELKKTDYITGKEELNTTEKGTIYVKENIAYTPQEAALWKLTTRSIMDSLHLQFRHLENIIDRKLMKTQEGILRAIKDLEFSVNEIKDKRQLKAKYIIETPPMSPIKLHIEIPITEISEEDLALKIAEIKMATYNLPQVVKDKLIGKLQSLPKMSARIKEQIIAALRKKK